MPADYKEAIAKILELLDHVKSTRPDFSVIDDTKFGLMLEYGVILNNYVEQYGLDDYETSVKAIEKITQFTSCEFVTHPFIIKYPDEMMKQMLVCRNMSIGESGGFRQKVAVRVCLGRWLCRI